MTEAVETKAKPVPKYKVTINSGEDKGDKGDVVLVHNFKQILIQRDQEVTISENYLNVLKHSTIETTVRDEKGNDVPVKIARFSFSAEPA